MFTVIASLLSAFTASLFSVFVERGFSWRRPRFSPETAQLARETLAIASLIFGDALATGGRLQHPWKVNEESVFQHFLDSNLEASRSRIVDRKFQLAVDEIRVELKNLYAAQSKGRPRIIVAGLPPTPQEMAWEKEIERKASVQRESADLGVTAVRRAMIRLSRKERHV